MAPVCSRIFWMRSAFLARDVLFTPRAEAMATNCSRSLDSSTDCSRASAATWTNFLFRAFRGVVPGGTKRRLDGATVGVRAHAGRRSPPPAEDVTDPGSACIIHAGASRAAARKPERRHPTQRRRPDATGGSRACRLSPRQRSERSSGRRPGRWRPGSRARCGRRCPRGAPGATGTPQLPAARHPGIWPRGRSRV